MTSPPFASLRMAVMPAMFATPKERHDNFTILDVSSSTALALAQIFGRYNVPLHLPSACAQE